MVIDAHQHFWKYRQDTHTWITEEMTAIRKDFLPKDLAPIYDKYHIDGCVAVQVDQTEEENKFFLSLAMTHSFIKGIVGWVDFRSANIEERLNFYALMPAMKGFRHIVQGEPDKRFLLGDFFCRGISLLKNFGFTYDILVYEHQLDQVEEFVRRFPDQPFVIDHIAKPRIKDHAIDEWKKRMTSIARHENVCVKLSGMVTEANWSKWTYNDLEPYMQVVLEAFGARRLLYGSDWPVCLVAAEYGKQFEVVNQFIQTLSTHEKQLILGENATRFYHL